ncbi:unnamed protein product [Discosporangium mesarthrocarpum]
MMSKNLRTEWPHICAPARLLTRSTSTGCAGRCQRGPATSCKLRTLLLVAALCCTHLSPFLATTLLGLSVLLRSSSFFITSILMSCDGPKVEKKRKMPRLVFAHSWKPLD